MLDIDGLIINIEMNSNSSVETRERNISYIMRLREDIKNKKKVNPVLQINLNNFCYKDDLEIKRNFYLLSEDNKLASNSLVIVDIYLPNIKKKMYNKGIKNLNELKRFLLIGLEDDREKALEYIGDDTIMKEYEEAIDEIRISDDITESYDKMWAIEDEAFNRGKHEGLEQGKEELIATMIDNGLNIEDISKYTGLSIEEINKLNTK